MPKTKTKLKICSHCNKKHYNLELKNRCLAQRAALSYKIKKQGNKKEIDQNEEKEKEEEQQQQQKDHCEQKIPVQLSFEDPSMKQIRLKPVLFKFHLNEESEDNVIKETRQDHQKEKNDKKSLEKMIELISRDQQNKQFQQAKKNSYIKYSQYQSMRVMMLRNHNIKIRNFKVSSRDMFKTQTQLSLKKFGTPDIQHIPRPYDFQIDRFSHPQNDKYQLMINKACAAAARNRSKKIYPSFLYGIQPGLYEISNKYEIFTKTYNPYLKFLQSFIYYRPHLRTFLSNQTIDWIKHPSFLNVQSGKCQQIIQEANQSIQVEQVWGVPNQKASQKQMFKHYFSWEYFEQIGEPRMSKQRFKSIKRRYEYAKKNQSEHQVLQQAFAQLLKQMEQEKQMRQQFDDDQITLEIQQKRQMISEQRDFDELIRQHFGQKNRYEEFKPFRPERKMDMRDKFQFMTKKQRISYYVDAYSPISEQSLRKVVYLFEKNPKLMYNRCRRLMKADRWDMVNQVFLSKENWKEMGQEAIRMDTNALYQLERNPGVPDQYVAMPQYQRKKQSQYFRSKKMRRNITKVHFNVDDLQSDEPILRGIMFNKRQMIRQTMRWVDRVFIRGPFTKIIMFSQLRRRYVKRIQLQKKIEMQIKIRKCIEKQNNFRNKVTCRLMAMAFCQLKLFKGFDLMVSQNQMCKQLFSQSQMIEQKPVKQFDQSTVSFKSEGLNEFKHNQLVSIQEQFQDSVHEISIINENQQIKQQLNEQSQSIIASQFPIFAYKTCSHMNWDRQKLLDRYGKNKQPLKIRTKTLFIRPQKQATKQEKMFFEKQVSDFISLKDKPKSFQLRKTFYHPNYAFQYNQKMQVLSDSDNQLLSDFENYKYILPVEHFVSPTKGSGLKASRKVKRHELIAIFNGTVMQQTQGMKKGWSDYMIEHSFTGQGNNKKYWVSTAQFFWSLGPMLNASKNPNVFLVKVFSDRGVQHLMISDVQIEKGEQFTWDYNSGEEKKPKNCRYTNNHTPYDYSFGKNVKQLQVCENGQLIFVKREVK